MPLYTIREENANTLTHAVGVFFGVGVTIYFIFNSVSIQNYWLAISTLLYAICMTFSFLTSTVYHAEKSASRKHFLRKFDHAAIYLHIAGSYTPFTLVVLRNEGYWGWSLFVVIWLAAIAGVVLSFTRIKNAEKVETACFVAMGWVVLFAFKPLIDVLTTADAVLIFWWLVAGGVFYTLGAIIYLLKRIEFMHAVWHIFVLFGSICHAIAIGLIKTKFI